MTAVGHMVCPFCARLGQQEHVRGCPLERADGLNAEGAYANGWRAAVEALLPTPFARIAELHQALAATVVALTLWERAIGEINVWPQQCRNALRQARAVLRG